MSTAIQRPNGLIYRARALPQALLLGPRDEDPEEVIVLSTHDVLVAQAAAERAIEDYANAFYGGTDRGFTLTISEPELTWYRRRIAGREDGEFVYQYVEDAERGRATVRWSLSIDEDGAA